MLLVLGLSQEPPPPKFRNGVPVAPTSLLKSPRHPAAAPATCSASAVASFSSTPPGIFGQLPLRYISHLQREHRPGPRAGAPQNPSPFPSRLPAALPVQPPGGFNQLGSPLSYFLAGRNFLLRQRKTATATLPSWGISGMIESLLLRGVGSRGGILPPGMSRLQGCLFPALIKLHPPSGLGTALGHTDPLPTGSLRCLILRLSSQHGPGGRMLIIIRDFWEERSPERQRSLIENLLLFFLVDQFAPRC